MATQYSISRVTELPADYLNALVDLSARAFRDDTGMLLLSGAREEAMNLYIRSVIAGGHLEGEVYVATLDGSDKPVSVSVWFPPGRTIWASEEQRQLGFYDYMASLDPATKEFISTEYVGTVMKFFNESVAPKNDLSSWCCYLVATEPTYQKQGIASALMRHTIERVTEQDALLALCAVAERTVKWYTKLGFTIAGYLPEFGVPAYTVSVWVLTMAVNK